MGRALLARLARALTAVLLCGVLLMATPAAGSATEDESTTSTEPATSDASETEPDSSGDQSPADQDDLEPADVPTAVWIGLGIVLVIALAWSLTGSASSDDEAAEQPEEG